MNCLAFKETVGRVGDEVRHEHWYHTSLEGSSYRHRKEITKLMFQALALRFSFQLKSNVQNSFVIFLRWEFDPRQLKFPRLFGFFTFHRRNCMNSLETKPFTFCKIRAAYAVGITHKPATGFVLSNEIVLDFLSASTGTLSLDYIHAGKWGILVVRWVNHPIGVWKVQHSENNNNNDNDNQFNYSFCSLTTKLQEWSKY